MKDDIGTVEYTSLLYDFYGALLNDNQNEIMSLYHEDNLSLSEIAEEMDMTRQAVHYSLKKAEKALRQYEDKLGLVEQYKSNQELAARAVSLAEAGVEAGSVMDELIDLIRRIAE